MDIRSVGLVTVFMAVPAACLIYGWWKSNDAPYSANWREKLPNLGLPLASLSLFLTSAFLIRGWRWDGQSFADRPPAYWVVLNWINILGWAFACFAVPFRRGNVRWALLAWCVSLPLLAGIVFLLGFDY